MELRKDSAAIYGVLIALGFVGAWLTGLFDQTDSTDVSGLELIWALLGFLIFVGSIAGMLFLFRHNQVPIQPDELSQWESVRRLGRKRYVRKLIVRGFVAGLLAVLWPAVTDYVRAGSITRVLSSVWIYLAVLLTCVFGMYYAAIRTWHTYEAVRDRVRSGMEPPEKSSAS
jgi:TRAP-type C4-dicarboxylate transport system permease small subunit